MTIDTTPHLVHPSKVDAFVRALQAGDPAWSYIVDHDPKGTGLCRINVYDENGDFVGYY